MTDEAKQVIVMRADLGMRKGKMIAQGAHASIAWLTNKLRSNITDFHNANPGESGLINITHASLSDAERAWIEGAFVKVCVRVDSEQELMDIAQQASTAGLTTHLIQDAGRTEFAGVPTYTCVGIGPNWDNEIDAITGELRLL